PREGHELAVRARARRVRVEQLDVDGRLLLHLLEHLETAPAPLALQPVGRIREVLQLAEDEARHDERAADEARLHDVGHAAVDDHRRVEERPLGADALLPSMTDIADERAELRAFDRARRASTETEDDRADDRREPP